MSLANFVMTHCNVVENLSNTINAMCLNLIVEVKVLASMLYICVKLNINPSLVKYVAMCLETGNLSIYLDYWN